MGVFKPDNPFSGLQVFGWIATPISAGALVFLLFFVVDNVFDQQVYSRESYRLEVSPDWRRRSAEMSNKVWSRELSSKLSALFRVFRVDERDE